jgi:hypothetical protein
MALASPPLALRQVSARISGTIMDISGNRRGHAVDRRGPVVIVNAARKIP